MVKGIFPENFRRPIERSADAQSVLKSNPMSLARPEILPYAIVRPTRTRGCSGCGVKIQKVQQIPEIMPQSIVQPVRTGGCGGCGTRIS
jgi:hypothetical protein